MAIGSQRNLDETRTVLTTWLREKVPRAKALRLSELRAPGMGFSNETLLFDLEWNDGEAGHFQPLVLRFRPENQIFPEYDLAQQYRVMEILAGTDVPVP